MQSKSGEELSSRALFAPPKEEDRRLPLKKLLENLQEADSPAAAAARYRPFLVPSTCLTT